MADQLLVRCYDVGLGDCIYVRVPDGDVHRHLLIDCGNKYSEPEALHAALDHLESELPGAGDGRKQLDLLVVTHPHEDHVRGIDTETFARFALRRLWMSTGMDPEHPQLDRIEKLHAFADETLRRLHAAAPTHALRELAESMLALNKADAMEALYHGLPDLDPELETRYVHADSPDGELRLFDDPAIRLHVLAPMHDIDLFYLGKVTERLEAFQKQRVDASDLSDTLDPNIPRNISRGDFERLRDRMLDNAFGFVLEHGHLINNLSVVLLLEWHGRRLLFTGDAEVQLSRKGEFEEGKRNGSWNVMWEKHRELLDAPLDFLKVGHHGSHNATPWTTRTVRQDGERHPHPINGILDALLPLPEPDAVPRGHAIVSTRRTTGYKTIPDPKLMIELGRRVANVQTYDEPGVGGIRVDPDKPQPWRTDLHGKPERQEPYLELAFDPLP